MKGILLFFSILFSYFGYAQIPSYYNNVNLSLTGLDLKSELSQKIIQTHTNELDYSDVWIALKQTDLDPSNPNKVLLLYGYDDSDGSIINDRTRDKNANSGDVGDWNREHTYPKSIASPSMVTSTPGAGTDAHHLRATDVQMNGNRGSKKFASSSGNAGPVGANWYPGDEWKGDVARMMMYMYLRYPGQPITQTECLPNEVGVGSAVSIDPDMITLFLNWNAEDTVSTYETNRNNILEGMQGNRNPFIDNPYLATIIWGGVVAQDKWNMTTTIKENDFNNSFNVYPNPSRGDVKLMFNYNSAGMDLTIYSIKGEKIAEYGKERLNDKNFIVKGLPQGIYVLKYRTDKFIATKKVVVN